MQKRWTTSEPTKKTLSNINEHPGIRYRDLLRLTGFSNRILSFHLKKLKKSKIVKAKKLGYNKIKYYPIVVKTAEFDILDHLLDSTRGKIIFFLLEHGDCKVREIVDYTNKVRSTTWVHLQLLKRAGIISVLRVNKNISLIG